MDEVDMSSGLAEPHAFSRRENDEGVHGADVISLYHTARFPWPYAQGGNAPFRKEKRRLPALADRTFNSEKNRETW